MRALRVAPLMALLAIGCAQDEEGPEPESAQRALGAAPVAAPTPTTPTPAVDPIEAFGPKYSGDRPRTFIAREADLAAVAKAPRVDPASLSAPQREVVAKSPVPVLLPGSAELVATAHLTAGPNWYAAAMTAPDHSVYVQGNRGSYEYGHIALDARGDALTRRPYTITRIHQILTLSFERFGISYAIDVECQRPMDDTKCTEDAYAVSLYEGMRVARGGDQ